MENITSNVIEDSVPEENKITQDVIDNLEKPSFFLINDESVTEYIYEFCKKLLEYAKDRHESKELAYAINLNTLDYIGAAFGDSKSIDVTSLVEQMVNTNYAFVVMHNHPSNNPFSPKDLNTFFSTPNMAILIVLGNKGTVYTIEKTKAISNEDYLNIKKILVEYRKNPDSYDHVINELSCFDIVYNVF